MLGSPPPAPARCEGTRCQRAHSTSTPAGHGDWGTDIFLKLYKDVRAINEKPQQYARV